MKRALSVGVGGGWDIAPTNTKKVLDNLLFVWYNGVMILMYLAFYI